MKIVFIILGIFLSGIVHADWEYTELDKKDQTWFLVTSDLKTVSTLFHRDVRTNKKGYKTVWIITTFVEGHHALYRGKKVISSMKGKLVFDCDDLRFGYSSYKSYGADDAILEFEQVDPKNIKFSDIAPYTKGYTWSKYACENKIRTK